MPSPVIVKKSIQEGNFVIGYEAIAQAETVIKINETVPSSTLDKQFLVGIELSKLKAIGIKCTAPMTVKTNSASLPRETFNLQAGLVLLWGEGESPVLGGDITHFFVSNTSETSGLFQVLVGINS